MAINFARKKATDSRLLRKSCESLLGISAGLMADDKLNSEEVLFLDLWLKENHAIANTWPGDIVARRVQEALRDKIISSDELTHLQQSLRELLGGTLQDTGAATGLATTLPLDHGPPPKIAGNTFCLTGEFLYGPRKHCAQVIESSGGTVLDNVRKDLNYLVIGTLINKEWKFTSFGNKIAKAVEYRQKGIPLRIISEEIWTEALP